MKEKLFFFSIKHPLVYILSLAIVVRLLAVIFTDGSITSSTEFNYYSIPEKWMVNPWIVYIARIVLGAFSLLIITLSYRITKIIADKTTALEIATFGSLLWCLPYASVHPISETVSLPFLLYGTLLIIKQHNLLDNNEKEKFHRTTFIIAGFFLGLGFAVCYQSIIYYIGILIVLLILKNWKGALMSLIGYVIAVGLTQTVVDLLVFHKPFVAMTAFFNEPMFETVLPMWALIFLLVVMVPPMSLLLIFGFIRVFRKYILLVIPTLMILLCSLFTYDFDVLMMAIPTYVIAGYVGWKEFYKNSAFWTKNKWLVLTCYILFALLNTALILFSFVYL